MIIYVFFVILFVWILVLTWVVISTRNHYLKLISRTKKQKIDDILEKLIEDDTKSDLEINNIKKELKELIYHSKYHLQKIGLIRFNPFERIGGEQSFVIALLDAENNGIVVNYIYTHDGLRAYTKKIKTGKGVGHDLSEEELKAIKDSK